MPPYTPPTSDCSIGISDMHLDRIETMGGTYVSARFLHASVIHNGIVYICGGRSSKGQALEDCWGFPHKDLQHLKIPPMPSCRECHTMIVFKDAFYVFGGSEGGFKGISADVFRFDVAKQEWRVIATGSSSPPARMSHGAVVHEGKMYVFGGRNESGQLNDLWAYDLETETWEEIWKDKAEGEGPKQRDGLKMSAYGTNLYIFGGYCDAVGDCVNDIWKFDTTTQQWTEIKTTGVRPAGRTNFSSVDTKDEWVIFGGRVSDEKDDDDDPDDDPTKRPADKLIKEHGTLEVFSFDFEKETWTCLPVIQRISTPWAEVSHRNGAAAVFDPETQTVISTCGYTHSDGLLACSTSNVLRLSFVPMETSMAKMGERITEVELTTTEQDAAWKGIREKTDDVDAKLQEIQAKVDEQIAQELGIEAKVEKVKKKEENCEEQVDILEGMVAKMEEYTLELQDKEDILKNLTTERELPDIPVVETRPDDDQPDPIDLLNERYEACKIRSDESEARLNNLEMAPLESMKEDMDGQVNEIAPFYDEVRQHPAFDTIKQVAQVMRDQADLQDEWTAQIEERVKRLDYIKLSLGNLEEALVSWYQSDTKISKQMTETFNDFGNDVVGCADA
eukprot:GHVU01230763.1.p1 GENE.GHVU01230763.1~~GHVU01230763.1.p1  ORF type:complete len:618 (-),score=101.98 GHVU01230763.1:553-2406(-)